MNQADESAGIEVYLELLPKLEALRELLANVIQSSLSNSQVRLAVPLQSRVKTWSSIQEKLSRQAGNVRDFRDYDDLVGLRVVVPFAPDLGRARDAIGSACHVIKAYRTTDRLKDDRFGYSAHHLVVRLPPGRKVLEQPSGRLQAEVQLLTAAQHLWAVSSHILQYKSADATPPELRRSVSRVAALLELVDLEFERLIESREAYKLSLRLDDDTAVLDVDVLDVALPKLWPPEHHYDPSMNGMVLRSLQRHGIRTLGDLRRLIATQRSAVFADSLAYAEELLEAVDHGTKSGNKYTIATTNGSRSHSNVTPEMIERARRGSFYAISGLTFSALQFAFGERQPPAGTHRVYRRPAG